MNDTKQMLKNASVLFVITLIAGLLLGMVYQVTKDPIAYQKQLALDKANQAVFESATSFEDIEIDAQALAEVIASDSNYSKIDVTSVLKASDDSGNALGYVLQVSSMGYGDDIDFTIGITNDGVINGISIISINETPGLGMNAEKVLVPQFASKNATQFTVNKNGATSDSEITAISGATITSNAVARGVNVAVAYFENVLKGGQ